MSVSRFIPNHYRSAGTHEHATAALSSLSWKSVRSTSHFYLWHTNGSDWAEVVLNIILGKFKVSAAKEAKDIVWNNALVRHPSMKDSSASTFPIQLERIKV